MRILCLLLTASLGLSACGDGDDVCLEAAEIFAAAEADYCADKSADCLYCDCLNQGLILDAETLDCKAPPALNPVNCTGLVKQSAQACVDDQAACEQDAVDLAEMTCQAENL